MVSLVDLAPTFCELAGLTPPMVMQGHSLLALIRQSPSNRQPEDRFFKYDEQKGKKYPVRGIITGHFKWIDYVNELDSDDVFYDLSRNPDELRNQIQEAPYRGVIKVLHDRLAYWRGRTRDPIETR